MKLQDAFFNILCAGVSCSSDECQMRRKDGGCSMVDFPPNGNREIANVARVVYHRRTNNILLPSAKRRLDESMATINKAYPPSVKIV